MSVFETMVIMITFATLVVMIIDHKVNLQSVGFLSSPLIAR
ncbi:MAG TPA: putative holin-like toxin [Candidatus Avamphibacillus sp.]|nr:putative holin-like toxin [Candidatus Avamphibacillus sp.]